MSEPIGTALSFFASCVKSGEPWTEHCEQARRAAHEALSALYAEVARYRAIREALPENDVEWGPDTTDRFVLHTIERDGAHCTYLATTRAEFDEAILELFDRRTRRVSAGSR